MGTYTGSDKRLQYLFQNGGGGGGGTTVIANPQEQATDTLNKLQVGSTIYGVSGGSGHNYSTTEKVVGTWNDKPLYEKSYTVASLTSTYVIIDTSINCNTVKIRNSSIGTFTVGGGYNNSQYVDGRMSSTSFPRIILNTSGLQVGMEGHPGHPISNFDFTIQYTKNAD